MAKYFSAAGIQKFYRRWTPMNADLNMRLNYLRLSAFIRGFKYYGFAAGEK